MKEITLSEFLSIIHNNEIDKIEEIEVMYGINVHCEVGLWYGDNIVIENNYNIISTKEQIMMRYHFLKTHNINNKMRNELLNLLVDNNWLQDYFNEYSKEYKSFGL